jgi:hypothetical protein
VVCLRASGTHRNLRSEVMNEGNDDLPRGFFLGLRNVIAVWIGTIVFLGMVYALMNLPGLP